MITIFAWLRMKTTLDVSVDTNLSILFATFQTTIVEKKKI
jgi:hypothetical protein